MKSYYLNTSNYLLEKNGAIREQYDIIKYIFSIIEYINVRPLPQIRCGPKQADAIINVDKMSRLFWGSAEQIHSIQFPFVLTENEIFLQAKFEDRVIDSQTISILSTIFEEREFIALSIDNMLDKFMDTMYDFEIKDNSYMFFCWRLFIYLLSFEPGYLRYDYDDDEGRVNEKTHPINHIDIFFSGNNTFKVGVKKRIVFDDLKKIVDINDVCYYLNISSDA